MPLQSSDLVMVGLGVQGDIPPDAVQPPLLDGIHLRWSFARHLGFPWYGFTLFRRPHSDKDDHRICITGGTQTPLTNVPDIAAITTSSTTWPTPQGTFTSDVAIAFTDDFPPTGIYEFDLANRSFLRCTLQPAYIAHWVQARIGFRGDNGRPECINFSEYKPSQGEGALVHSGTTFVVREKGAIVPWAIQLVSTSIGTLSGLNCGYSLEIDLSNEADVVELRLTYFEKPATIEAFDAEGARVDAQTMQSPVRSPEWVVLRGARIVRIVVTSPTNDVILHEICLVPRARREGGGEVVVTGFLGDVPVVSTTVSGGPGTIAVATLQFDTITAVQCSSADASLIELCCLPIARGARGGWEICPNFPAPLCLPITHPDYPCSGNAPVNEPAAQARALARISYGPKAPWAASFSDLHDELLDLVVGGPTSTPMADRTLAPISGAPDPPDPGVSAPNLPTQYPLDMVMLASLHPAMAQMLGLYWIDTTATPGVAYDYMIVANYYGYVTNSPGDLLEGLFSNTFGVYGYIVYDLVRAPAAPLPPPGDVRSYALEGATRAMQGGGLDDATNSAGLRWDLGAVAPGILAPGHAVMYHVWRADLQNNDTPSPGGLVRVGTSAGSAAVVLHRPPRRHRGQPFGSAIAREVAAAPTFRRRSIRARSARYDPGSRRCIQRLGHNIKCERTRDTHRVARALVVDSTGDAPSSTYERVSDLLQRRAGKRHLRPHHRGHRCEPDDEHSYHRHPEYGRYRCVRGRCAVDWRERVRDFRK